jgi:hypothetical protein
VLVKGTYLVVLVSVVASFGVTSVAAWEDDFHYGLTKWLAERAGFSGASAETIALGNKRTDEGILDARRLVFWYACAGSDANASRIVRNLHFPTFADLPSPPCARSVEAGGAAAIRQSELEVGAAPPSSQHERDFALLKLGEALHVLQDSWAHQGEPDIPPWPCERDLAWAHPAPRGGWHSHDADHTAKYPPSAMEAARRTYDVLVSHAKVKPWAVARTPRPRKDLEGDLKEFVDAATKTDKARWFSKHGFGNLAFLTSTTLSDGAEEITRQLQFSRLSFPGTTSLLVGATPPDVVNLFHNFWGLWVSTTDFARLVTLYVAPDFVAKNLGLAGDPRAQTEAALAMWRVWDHGSVARFGHVPPVPGTRAASELAAMLKDPRVFLVRDGLRMAMVSLGTKGPALAIGPWGTGRYAAVGRFIHAPHDSVVVTAEQVQGLWRVTAVRSIVEH